MFNNLIPTLAIFFLLNNNLMIRFIGKREIPEPCKRVFFSELTQFDRLLLDIQALLYHHLGIVEEFEKSKYFTDLDPIKYHQYLTASRKCKQMYPTPYPDPFLAQVTVPKVSFLSKLIFSRKCRRFMRDITDHGNRCYFYEIMDFGEESY